MRGRRPTDLNDWTTALVVTTYAVTGDNDVARNAVQGILLALTPVEAPPARNCYVSPRRKGQRWLKTDRVTWPEQLCPSRVGPALKKTVEGSERRTPATSIPARDVHIDPNAGGPRSGNRARPFDGAAPCSNVASAEGAELKDCFRVVRPDAALRQTRSKGVSALVSRSLIKMSVLSIPSHVVDIQRRMMDAWL